MTVSWDTYPTSDSGTVHDLSKDYATRSERLSSAPRVRIVKGNGRGGPMKERMRNEDARGGDVIVQDSIASGKPDLPIGQDPGRDTNVAINADELGEKGAGEAEGAGERQRRGR
jgi:hypothetical protein